MNHVRVVSNGMAAGTKIFVDGVELTNVESFTVTATTDKPHTVDVRMYIDELDIDGPVKVVRRASP